MPATCRISGTAVRSRNPAYTRVASSLRERRSAADRFARSMVCSSRWRTIETSIRSLLWRGDRRPRSDAKPEIGGQHRLGVLTERGRRRANRRRRVGQLERRAQHAERAHERVLDDRPSSRRAATCGSANSSPRSRTEPHGTPAAVSRSIQCAAGAATKPRVEDRTELAVRGDALAVGREPILRRDVRHAAEAPPLVVVADRQHELAVRGRERLVRHDRRMAVAHPRRRRLRWRSRCRPGR